jgi:hypothetical protein
LDVVEGVTRDLELGQLGLGLTFPVPGMMSKHWRPGPFNEELVRDREGYERAIRLLRKAPGNAGPNGNRFLEYWMGRLEFGISYLNVVEAVMRAASMEEEIGRKPDDREAHRELICEVEGALELARSAIESYARVAVDRSDLGAIATMSEYVWRWLKGKTHDLSEEASEMK